jgi:antitoxin CcdA
VDVSDTSIRRKVMNVSLAEHLLSEAEDLGIDVSLAAEAGLVKAIADKRAGVWLEENAEAIASYNDYLEKNGLPLDEYRMF